jgi:excinuclease ABC subunit A
MSKHPATPAIRLRGVRQHNLKNIDLDLPLGRLIVITGLSGSGKSSLAFDTLFAEGQRRYVETFSPYARQFFDRMDKPAADRIDGIPPAIAIEQRNTVKTTRSTVGTMTEICEYMKTLWPHLARLHCRQCGRDVRKESPQLVWKALWTDGSDPKNHGEPAGGGSPKSASPGTEILITFEVPLSERLSLDESLALIARQGYQRVLAGTEIVRLEEAGPRLKQLAPSEITVVQDRLALQRANRARFIEGCEQAYHFGKGRLTLLDFMPPATLRNPRPFSNRLHCAECDIQYREASPALFSFNHPLGACPKCRGFGRVISIDYRLAVPDRALTLAQGVVRPWRSGFSAECQEDLLKFCKARDVRTNVRFCDLPQAQQDWVINGDPDYGTDAAHQWPHAWYGVKGYFRWLEGRAYKMHVRVLLSRYRAYETCPDCHGARFQPEALLYRLPLGRSASLSPAKPRESLGQRRSASPSLGGVSLADFYRFPIRDALAFLEELAGRRRLPAHDPLGLVLEEVLSRLRYLAGIGLGYISLDRPTRTLSGGETERVNLTTCLGTRLVNTLFVLDEPSVGLHPHDTARLVKILEQLRDAGNTVVVVEHEAGVIRAADQVVDLGPGHGESGGQVVFQGSYPELLAASSSLTGQYLAGRKEIEIPRRRPVPTGPALARPGAARPRNSKPESGVCPILALGQATANNLKDLSVRIPLQRLVCVTGVSGSGKTTLVRDVLLPALAQRLQPVASSPAERASEAEADGESPTADPAQRVTLEGWQPINQVVLVDQSPLGKTPRSNAGVYTGAFDEIRELFAQSEGARQRALNASSFSFNSAQGQCERCRGVGFEKIEMQFLSDIFIRCPDCNGRRYRPHILEVTLPRPNRGEPGSDRNRGWSIGDVLEATVDEVALFLDGFPASSPARRAAGSLALLQEVGLGYLRLGQPINTLSGGESQRLKLVRHLAGAPLSGLGKESAGILFLFDEPTTGLHFADVRILLQAFQRLVEAGHSLVVIEHNLDVIKCADWILDLGPGAGDEGGRLVAQGTPETVAACPESLTGRWLRGVLPRAGKPRRSRG